MEIDMSTTQGTAGRAGHSVMVEIEINGQTYQITKGNHSTADLKALAGVPLADDLDEIKNNKPHPLAEDGHTNINGGEVFVSHPKGSGSSSD
jgi:hypothetical protein